ncbi:MAG: ChaN family lipoprotein [Gammaproteobacteria bacterium]|nr:ChaN family lipoprotein [Gammaproteobacteria bacterium]
MHTETANGTQASALLLKDHNLVDKIWDVQAGELINKSQLLASIMRADYVLLGENHDNISHHMNQAWVVENLSKKDHEASVSFEMIDDQQGDLIINKNITSSTMLIEILNHIKSSWNYETYYSIVFDSVIQAGFKIYPANLSRQTLMKAVMENNQNLSPRLGQVLSQSPLPQEQKTVLQNEIIKSHCGMLDAQMVDRMVEMQRIRDAAMAVSLLNSDADIKVLIAGINHVRKDHGVPMYLLQENKKTTTVSVAQIEVESDHNDITDYIKHWQDKNLPFDYIWFTASAERPTGEDFCASLKKRFKGKQDKSS